MLVLIMHLERNAIRIIRVIRNMELLLFEIWTIRVINRLSGSIRLWYTLLLNYLCYCTCVTCLYTCVNKLVSYFRRQSFTLVVRLFCRTPSVLLLILRLFVSYSSFRIDIVITLELLGSPNSQNIIKSYMYSMPLMK